MTFAPVAAVRRCGGVAAGAPRASAPWFDAGGCFDGDAMTGGRTGIRSRGAAVGGAAVGGAAARV